MGLLMLTVVSIITKEKSNAHTNKSVLGANERIQARAHACTHKRTNGCSDAQPLSNRDLCSVLGHH